MSAPQVPKSKWGSLLSGAVAGLESRLDNILTEEGSAALKNAEIERRREKARKAKGLDADSQQVSLTSKEHEPNSEDQVIKQASLFTTATTEVSNRHDEQVSNEEVQKHSVEMEKSSAVEKTSQEAEEMMQEAENSNVSSLETARTQAQPQIHSLDPAMDTVSQHDNTLVDSQLESALEAMRGDVANYDLTSAREDEMQSYLERIDALQAKLQYLANDAASTAKQSAMSAKDGSWEKILAAKDEQIALLLEEGTKLSKAEVTQAATIRRLRIKANEDAKAQAEVRRLLVQGELSYPGMKDRLEHLEADKREAQSKLMRLSRLEKELGDARRERGIKDATIHDLQSQLNSTRRQADETARSANEKAFEQEKKTSKSLRDDLSNAKIEQKLRDDKAKAQIKEAQDQLGHERERHRGIEQSYRNEVSILETRIELMRERSEEASSGTTNDLQTKLMRQIETLQSQYGVASENWQSVESSLQARVTILEREKDESSQGEAEARKKARDNSIALRRLREQLDDMKQRCLMLEHELQEQRSIAEKHLAHSTSVEKVLAGEQKKFEAERHAWDATFQTKLDEEKAKWQLGPSKVAGDIPSMLTSPREIGQRKNSYMDISSNMSRRHSSRQISELSLIGAERPTSRRTSTFMSKTSIASPNGFDYERSTTAFDMNQAIGTPSIHTVDIDEHENSSSPHRTVNDVLSGATASAGPSVQLVERMSAAVRRLETEKAASRDELARLSSQRDEARKEVVDLMREVEQKRTLEMKVDTLDRSVAELSQRYTTTLEMLGEKSERVQELEADIIDIKKIYRELVESTMK